MAHHMTQQRRSLGRRRLGPARASARVLTALAVAAAVCTSSGSDVVRAREPVADDSTTVSIGFYYPDVDPPAGVAAAVPDLRRAAEVMVDAINADGGAGGREIEPVFYEIGSGSTDPAADQAAACAAFTQDNEVLAVIDPGVGAEELSACIAEAGVAFIYTGLTSEGEATFEDRPLLLEPISVNLERLAQVEVEGLADQDYLSHAPGSSAASSGAPVKLGVVVYDLPAFRDAYDNVMAPAFEAAGTPVETVSLVGADAGTSADVDSAVLRFASEGVTHVTFLTASGAPPGLFMLRATAQGYTPRYGLSSQDAPQIIAINLPDAAGQLRGAVGVGWLPFGDVADATDPDVVTPSYQRCIDTMAEGGITAEDTHAAGLLAFVCDGWWFLDAALEAAGADDLSPQSLVDGAEQVGDSYDPAAVYSTSIGPDRHDGVASVRYFAFSEDCGCFQYTSEEVPL